MPPYRFSGLVSHVYPETKDARDRPLGLVEPGDGRDFGQAPDHLWVPTSGGSGEDGSDEEAAGEAEPAAEEAAPADPPGTPAGPVPAPPAVIPGA